MVLRKRSRAMIAESTSNGVILEIDNLEFLLLIEQDQTLLEWLSSSMTELMLSKHL